MSLQDLMIWHPWWCLWNVSMIVSTRRLSPEEFWRLALNLCQLEGVLLPLILVESAIGQDQGLKHQCLDPSPLCLDPDPDHQRCRSQSHYKGSCAKCGEIGHSIAQCRFAIDEEKNTFFQKVKESKANANANGKKPSKTNNKKLDMPMTQRPMMARIQTNIDGVGWMRTKTKM